MEGPCPSQALVERDFVEPQPPPPAAGTFLGRGLASSPALGRRAEARGQGGGLSMGLCASSQEASVAKLAALTLQPTGPRPPGMVPVIQRRQRCPHKHLLLVQEFPPAAC